MSTSREITIWCDVSGCSAWTYGDAAPQRTPREARAAAKRLGWDSVRSGSGEPMLDRCPNCGLEGKMP